MGEVQKYVKRLGGGGWMCCLQDVRWRGQGAQFMGVKGS